jgi:predicted GIY-YIG superfamily endonuclease
MKLGEIIIAGRNAPLGSVIYIIKDGNEILYVGKSQWVENRLIQHLGYGYPPSYGYFDEFARAAIPQCWEWEVDFVVIPVEILNLGSEARVKHWISNMEISLIRSLRPKYNIQHNYD